MIKFWFINSKKAQGYSFCVSNSITEYSVLENTTEFGKLGYRKYKRIMVNRNQALSLDKYMQPGMKEIVYCHFYTQLSYFSFKNMTNNSYA